MRPNAFHSHLPQLMATRPRANGNGIGNGIQLKAKCIIFILARGFLRRFSTSGIDHTKDDSEKKKMVINRTEATTVRKPCWLPFWLLFVYLQRIFKCLPQAWAWSGES